MKSYTDIYNYYRDNVYPCAEKEYSWYKKADNLRDAVEKAFLSKDEQGKVHRHQCRVGRYCLALAAKIALEYFDGHYISSFENFHSIYQFVDSVSCKVKGFGELGTYEVALRITKYLGCELQKVYLHADVTIGTCALSFNVKDGDIIPYRRISCTL
ncbi:hypothetical protein [Nostoc sp.]|uniref:hypothetical protein n=1 Tax=Nostoc sp. TaxID=1180 RepID=UPI002FFA5142